MRQEHRQFMLELGCDKTKHSHRSLLEHLKGVHDLLRDWGNDEETCLAGLFHSIYGTNTFKHRSLSDRNALIDRIGATSEGLVFIFSEGKRPFFKNIDSMETRLRLMEIEAANLIDQHGGHKVLRKLQYAKISDGAKAAIAMELSR